MVMIIPIFAYVNTMKIPICLIIIAAISSCARGGRVEQAANGNDYAKFFSIETVAGKDRIISFSPFDGTSDTLSIEKPLRRIICMSTSYVAYLSSIGCDSAIVGLSGSKYVSDPGLKDVPDVGYDASPAYEKIIALKPDVVLTYTVSSVAPRYVDKLRAFGIKVFVLYEHLEDHPLARTEYVKLFGAMMGRRPQADSVYATVSQSYLKIAERVVKADPVKKKVLLNIPYADQWFIPGADNYMSIFIRDAGGEVLGAQPGKDESSIIGIEKAYELSKSADFWLDVGWCRTRKDLFAEQPLFREFPINRENIYNNTLRMTPGGGNDFWESGAVRADLVLSDLVKILHPELSDPSCELHYYIKLK